MRDYNEPMDRALGRGNGPRDNAVPATTSRADPGSRSVLNVAINDDDAVVLRRHVRAAHPSLLDHSGGPLPSSGLSGVPTDVLAAVHEANHMHPWRDHDTDDWRA